MNHKAVTMGQYHILIIAFFAAVLSACPSVSTQTERTNQEASPTENSSSETQSEGPSKNTKSYNRVFSSQVAGPRGQGFYTSDEADLREQLDGFLAKVQTNSDIAKRDLLGLISPHAGYRYSGPTAAHGYKQLEGRSIDTVVVIALSHRRHAQKVALLNYDAYQTPLGPIPIDVEAVQALASQHSELFELNESVFRGEHSLEVQLPFLQRVIANEFRIIPIIIATHNEEHCQQLARILHQSFGGQKDVLFVSSTDLTHQYPYDRARELDQNILSLITEMRIDDYRSQGPRSREMPCGYYPVLTMLHLFDLYRQQEGIETETHLLNYQNSGDTAGGRSGVVGYGSVAFSLGQNTRRYVRGDQRELMEIAQQSVEAAVHGRDFSPGTPSSEALRERGAAFVTLNCETDNSNRCIGPGENLRGCIGHVIAREPLYECVANVARSAAIHDRRFPRLRESELQFVNFEISVLTPPEIITDPTTVIVGRHGLIMSRGQSHGLLLPQVPIELGWDRETFLARTCRKARMENTCWQDASTRIERFGAVVWGEELFPHDHY